jgi:predicted phage-related endonuclease
MKKTEWLEKRKGKIGGSTIGALMGLSKWSTALEAYYRLLGLIPEIETTELMQKGIDAEPVIFAELESLCPKMLFKHLGYADSIVFEDRFIVSADALGSTTKNDDWDTVVEIKYTENPKIFKGDEIPPSYYAQVQWYAGFLGLENIILAYKYKDKPTKIIDVLFDEAYFLEMKERAYQVVASLDNNEKFPKWIAPLITKKDAKLLYSENEQEARVPVDVSEENEQLKSINALIRERKEEIKNLEHAKEQIQTKLLSFSFLNEGNPVQFADGTRLTIRRGERRGYVVEPSETFTVVIK